LCKIVKAVFSDIKFAVQLILFFGLFYMYRRNFFLYIYVDTKIKLH
jgi:hypothetical protein